MSTSETPELTTERSLAAIGELGFGTQYDPDPIRMFVNRVGLFPPGSIPEPAGGSWVGVPSGACTPETRDRPRCIMIHTRGGRRPEFLLEMDLAEGGEIAAVSSASDPYGRGG